MIRGKRNRWLAWALPLIALRLFLPVGYMVDASAHGLSIVVCSSATYKDGLASSGAHSHHHDHGGGTADPSAGHPDHDICPFSLGTIAAPAFHLATPTIVEPALVGIPPERTSFFVAAGPIRLQQSRAPPRVS